MQFLILLFEYFLTFYELAVYKWISFQKNVVSLGK